MNSSLEWLIDTAFVWLLAIGSVGVILFAIFRDKDKRKEKEKTD